MLLVLCKASSTPHESGSSLFLQVRSGLCVFKAPWSHQKYIKHWVKIAKTFRLFPVIVLFPFWTRIFKRIDICAWGKKLLTVNKEAKIFPHQQQSKLCEAFCIIFHHATINKKYKKEHNFYLAFILMLNKKYKSGITRFGVFSFVQKVPILVLFLNNYKFLDKFMLCYWRFLPK